MKSIFALGAFASLLTAASCLEAGSYTIGSSIAKPDQVLTRVHPGKNETLVFTASNGSDSQKWAFTQDFNVPNGFAVMNNHSDFLGCPNGEGTRCVPEYGSSVVFLVEQEESGNDLYTLQNPNSYYLEATADGGLQGAEYNNIAAQKFQLKPF